jgi:negative regulator of flagellin synthesis FlgM
MLGLALFTTKESRVHRKQINHSSSMADKATASAQSVSVDLSVSEKVKSLSSEPPVNIEVVTEIRQKVSEGRYPIDLNAITNKLFESIKEGEG